ncbi:MAG TPA: acetoacetate decarboxylase family protein [Deltaproteobacteria bacterium]|nr:acetoacetate decarboxylase family protein [Deltaproteobacteria bacterium]HQN18788.1 acetoacetate decarboxylase family protein [Syntrophobacteraceae bacterium]
MKRWGLDTDHFFQGLDQLENLEYDVRLPIFYYDNTAMTAIYTASTAKMKKYLPSAEMHPVEMFPGRCLIAFSAFEYRSTDIDPYNEFSITGIISYGKRQVPGLTSSRYMLRNCFTAYILHLPVTSERARRGGFELAGYPKFLADISFSQGNGFTTCTVAENGKRILSLRGKKIGTSQGRLTKFILYTVKNGIPLKANLYVNPLQFRQAMGLGKASLDIAGGHPICDHLKGLGLSRWPVMYQYMPSYQAILFNSKNIIDD